MDALFCDESTCTNRIFFSKISPFAFSYDRKHHSISSISEGFLYPNKDKNIRFLCNTFIMSSLHVQNSSDVQI